MILFQLGPNAIDKANLHALDLTDAHCNPLWNQRFGGMARSRD
jgi:hypothetical protein